MPKVFYFPDGVDGDDDKLFELKRNMMPVSEGGRGMINHCIKVHEIRHALCWIECLN